MKCNHKERIPSVLIMFVISTLLVFTWGVNAQAQTSRAAASYQPAVMQQPLYSEYRGLRLGMTPDDARSKLGKTAFSDAELDYFVLSETETVQVGYDAQRKVKTISVDYLNGTGAPDPKSVVGADLELRENGTLYRVVHFDNLGFWVSYSRTTGPVIIVTITIQQAWKKS